MTVQDDKGAENLHEQVQRVASEVSLLFRKVFLLAWGACNRGTFLLAGGWGTWLRHLGGAWFRHLGRAGHWSLGRGLAGDFALLLLLVGHFP